MASSSSGPSELAKGASIMGRYQIMERVGKGGFGNVYMAQDMSSGNALRAVKQLIPDTTGKSYKPGEQQALWQQETTTLSKLSHPGLPKIFEWFYLPSGFFIIMEWVEGKLLEETLKSRRTPLEEEEALLWGGELADILNYLHSQKPYPIIYGDLKPENIMITPDGHARLIDFGVARFLNPAVKIPQSFTMVSPGFSPPEQYQSPNMSQKNDIYAFGATVYTMLTKENLEKYKFKIPRISRVRRVDPELDSLLNRCLMEKPEERCRSVGDVHQTMQNLYTELKARREKQKTNPYWRGG